MGSIRHHNRAHFQQHTQERSNVTSHIIILIANVNSFPNKVGKQKELTVHLTTLPPPSDLHKGSQALLAPTQDSSQQVTLTNPRGHTYTLPWRTLVCCMGCTGLMFPLGGSFSLGNLSNLGLDEDAQRTPPLEERPLPLALPPLLLDREGRRENTDV